MFRVTEATQVWPDPLIIDKRKVLVSFGFSCCLPVSVGRSLLGTQRAGGGGDVLVAATALGAVVVRAVVVSPVVVGAAVVGAAVVAPLAVGLADAAGVALGVGVGVAVSATTRVGGGEAWTAEPLLVPLTISAAITATMTTAAAITAARRSQ